NNDQNPEDFERRASEQKNYHLFVPAIDPECTVHGCKQGPVEIWCQRRRKRGGLARHSPGGFVEDIRTPSRAHHWQRHEEGTARVVPIILRPSPWRSASFSKLQALPTDGEPINSKLEAADLILLLASAEFLASDYVSDVELRRAMRTQLCR